MKKLMVLAVGAIFLLSLTTKVLAQEWTKDQTDVWKTVQDEWAKWKAGDIDGMATLLHEKYQGWSNRDPLPIGKELAISWYKDWAKIRKIESCYLDPARIVISKNSAVADYYFEFTTLNVGTEKQEKITTSGKNVEFWVKEDGKWLLLGDMTVMIEPQK